MLSVREKCFQTKSIHQNNLAWNPNIESQCKIQPKHVSMCDYLKNRKKQQSVWLFYFEGLLIYIIVKCDSLWSKGTNYILKKQLLKMNLIWICIYLGQLYTQIGTENYFTFTLPWYINWILHGKHSFIIIISKMICLHCLFHLSPYLWQHSVSHEKRTVCSVFNMSKALKCNMLKYLIR